MRIAVVGSRDFPQPDTIRAVLNDYFSVITVFISGGARGTDKIAEEWIDEWNKTVIKEAPNAIVRKIIFTADWEKYGKRAGFIRNELIIREADFVMAFWDGKSKGTKHSIDLAIKMKKPLDIYVRQAD